MEVKLVVVLQISFLLIPQCSAALLRSIHHFGIRNAEQSISAKNLLASIQNERNFSTLVMWRREANDCFSELFRSNATDLYGILNFNDNYTIYLKGYYNVELLNVVCFRDFIDFALLDNMAESLEHMRETRIVFLLKNFNTTEMNDLEELFNYCDQQQILNVLAVHEDYERTGNFYSFKRFPNFTIESFQWPSIYYTNRLRDLQGFALRSIPSQAEPGSIVYNDGQGRKRSSGYIYHLISTFASKLNASLRYINRVNVGDRIAISILQDLTSNYELDLAICLQMPIENESLYAYSDVVEISNWMPMLPRAGYIERYEIYKLLFTNNTLIIDIIIFIILSLIYKAFRNDTFSNGFRCNAELPSNEAIFNDQIFRGVIGLPYEIRQAINFKFCLIYFLIFAQGIVWNTAYSGHFHTYFNRPPTGQQINSFEALKALRIQIVIPEEQFVVLEKIMPDSFMHQYRELFLIIYELRDFYALRKSFNTNFAYSVHSETWSMINRQQHYFSQHLFRVSELVEFHHHMEFAVPLAENSVYRSAFNAYLLDIKANGLWNHWTAMTFYEMIEAGKLSYEDLAKPISNQAVCVRDLYYIWFIFIGGNILGCCCVIAEILYNKPDKQYCKTTLRNVNRKQCMM